MIRILVLIVCNLRLPPLLSKCSGGHGAGCSSNNVYVDDGERFTNTVLAHVSWLNLLGGNIGLYRIMVILAYYSRVYVGVM